MGGLCSSATPINGGQAMSEYVPMLTLEDFAEDQQQFVG